ncbi:MAG: BACON domain-containing protein, partial [Odoribacteraceae bacterium]|nr:BACON domain-containing protein [Odoribacteraceae bacterium]
MALLFGACIRDLDGGARERIIVGDSTALVTLSLSTPAPPTRSLPGSANENKVVDVDVLLFTTDNDKLYYRAPATGAAITDAPDGETPPRYPEKTFTVRLPINPLDGGSTPIPYKMVIIANARASVAGYAPNSIISSGPTRETLLNGLASAAAGAKLAYPFPMWGEYASNLTIAETSNPGTLNVDLTRAVARVDVSLDADVINFILDSVLLYNYRDAGHVAPKYESGTPAVAACYLAGNKVPGSFLGYDLTGTTDPNGKAFQEIIYAFEAANVDLTDQEWMKNTCLVVGGRFDGNNKKTYYRVEFVDDNDDPLDLKRNYLYNVVIDEVKADGWPGPWLAYVNKPSNIVARITPWNDGGMNEIEFNGQYYLAVDKSHIDFYKEGLSKSLRVVTDYTTGWTIEELPGWLTHASTTPPAGAGVQSTLVFTAVPNNPGDVPRSGHFYIVAGNLRKKITVAQSADEEFSLEVNPWQITFNKTPTAEQVTVSPVPAADGVDYALTFGASANLENDFWASGFGLPSLNTTTTFQLKPAINESGVDISGTVLVTFTGPLGQTITRTVSIKQLAYDIFEALLSNPYPISGGSQTFTVKSTVPWRLSNSDSWLELAETSEEHSPTSSYTYTFTLDPITTYTPTRTAVVNVASSDSALPANTKFEISQEGAALTLIVT